MVSRASARVGAHLHVGVDQQVFGHPGKRGKSLIQAFKLADGWHLAEGVGVENRLEPGNLRLDVGEHADDFRIVGEIVTEFRSHHQLGAGVENVVAQRKLAQKRGRPAAQFKRDYSPSARASRSSW